MNTCSPIIPCHGILSENELYIKRDDLLPFSFGGNKVRIAEEFFADMIAKSKNCMVGYGNSRSNLCRVLANMSLSRLGMGKCHIISPREDDGSRVETNNSLFVNSFHSILHTCSKKEVAATVASVLQECRNLGLDPYYIYGNEYGTGNEAVPVRAYVKAYEEIKDSFDYIFLASGTGMTQAGLIAGRQLNHGFEHIVGISVARQEMQAVRSIKNYLNAYYNSIDLPLTEADEIIVDDSYLCGGYGQYSTEILNTIQTIMCMCGIPLDPTYTGKAFYGMTEYIKKNNIHNKKILFLHTGGAPLFFDNISSVFKPSLHYDQLAAFLKKIDAQLPTPLSKRVDLEEFTRKLVDKAYICAEIKDGKVLSLVAGYIDNLKDNMSYITLVGTLVEARRQGLAIKLLQEFIHVCRSKNLRGIHLHTEQTNAAAIRLYTSVGFVDYVDKENHRPLDKHLVYWL